MRLIDADRMKTTHEIQMGDYNSMESIREWIDRQPTAYDVEAVVREITDIGQRFCDSVGCNEFCKDEMAVCDHAAIIGAILDVVKRGGRND